MSRFQPSRRFEIDALRKLDALLTQLGKKNQTLILPNVELFDSAKQAYFECDVIIASRNFVGVLELKHWGGDIRITADGWDRGRMVERDPHKVNGNKCRILKTWLLQKIPSLRKFTVQSIVAITHEEASVQYDRACISQNGDFDKDQRIFTYSDLKAFVGKYVAKAFSEDAIFDNGQFDHIRQKLELLALEPKHFASQIPGYRIVKALDEGRGCSEFLAIPESHVDNKPKRLRIFETIDNPEARERQARNFKLLEKLPPHPNILKTHNVPNDKNLFVEVSEWSDSGTLRSELKRTSLSAKARSVALQLLSALNFLDSECVVHRDIRPENIVVSGDRFFLTNFDLAFDPEASFTVFSDEEQKLLSPYRAPELLQHEREPKSDIYSLGVILYELCTNSLPISDCYELAKMGGRLNEEAMTKLRLSLTDEDVVDVIYNSVVSDPKARISAEDALRKMDFKVSTRPIAEIQPGDVFSVLQVESQISSGGSSKVYKALREGELTIALKVANLGQTGENLRREKRFLNRIRSPYVVQCFNSFTWGPDGPPFLELEFADGSTLRSLIDSRDKPSREQFLEISKALLEALESIHSGGSADSAEESVAILHNDLTPPNIVLVGDKSVPKIIDFGLASHPGRELYSGSSSYIAPDLIEGGEVERCVSGDLYSLAVTLFEWLSGRHPFGNKIPVFGEQPYFDQVPPEFEGWFRRALKHDSEERFKSASEMRSELNLLGSSSKGSESTVEGIVVEGPLATIQEEATDVGDRLARFDCSNSAFVSYVNGLHNIAASNEFAIAESQALSEFFKFIHVQNPITDEIFSLLTDNSKRIIVLSGHAGDGKSTIALDLIKRIRKLPADQPLDRPLERRESLNWERHHINIVKDMSDGTPESRTELWREAFSDENSWLIIANTGVLLSSLKEVASADQKSDVEDQILLVLEQRLSSKLEDRHQLKVFIDNPMYVVNLSMADNVPLFKSFVEKISSTQTWGNCEKCPVSFRCPIYSNVELLRLDVVKERLSLIYRRLTSYGQRITARQLTAHVSYALTGGLECVDVLRSTVDLDDIRRATGLWNTFFGFLGSSADERAKSAIHPIRLLTDLDFGARPFPLLERYLRSDDWEKKIRFPSTQVRELFSTIRGSSEVTPKERIARARQQIRRFLYLIGEFESDLLPFADFFLESPMVRTYVQWLENAMTKREREELRDKLLLSLFEEFTGFRTNQFARSEQRLFITLRKTGEHSAAPVQLIQAIFPFESFHIDVDKQLGELRFRYKSPEGEESLELTLPLLDSVISRFRGELGQQLDGEHQNQLKWFKSRLLRLRELEPDAAEDEASVKLLQATSSGELRRCEVEFTEEKIDAKYIS